VYVNVGKEDPAVRAARDCGSRTNQRRLPRAAERSIPAIPHEGEPLMLMIREVMYCKPGKVRALVDKFVAMSKLGEKSGMPKMKVMTDFSAERYWTVVAEMDVPSLKAFEDMMAGMGTNKDDQKQLEEIMKGYHDLVDHGKREIYKIEG
jgi:hypothetical protein